MAQPGMEVGTPNCTLYLQNLNEKVNITHMKQALRDLFTSFGHIYEIIVKKRVALRGQAFIIYSSLEESRRAVEALQGHRLFGKSMVVRYARFKSDVLSKADGTYEIEKRHREQDRNDRSRLPRLTRRQIIAQMMNNPVIGTMMGAPVAGGPLPLGLGSGANMQLPNKVLFIQGIPDGFGLAKLEELFRWPGYCEVRVVPNRPDVAFVEYESEPQANAARLALDKYEIAPSVSIRVTFARR